MFIVRPRIFTWRVESQWKTQNLTRNNLGENPKKTCSFLFLKFLPNLFFSPSALCFSSFNFIPINGVPLLIFSCHIIPFMLHSLISLQLVSLFLPSLLLLIYRGKMDEVVINQKKWSGVEEQWCGSAPLLQLPLGWTLEICIILFIWLIYLFF